jgi:hypothetical protein
MSGRSIQGCAHGAKPIEHEIAVRGVGEKRGDEVLELFHAPMIVVRGVAVKRRTLGIEMALYRDEPRI